ncbi:MAG: hypothetical protein HY842_03805 [Bacteroidetes bacterium]|nr:hypothetical protein [Bacteroidota bacterium]
MKKRTSLSKSAMPAALGCLFLCFFWVKTRAQTPTYYGQVQPILLANCTPCHRPGGGAPFPVLTCEDATNRASFIAHVTARRYMPPWFADPDFRSFHNQKILTNAEIETLRQWAGGGAPCGIPLGEVAVLQQDFEKNHPAPDQEVPMQQPFTIPGNNTEQFRIFILPTGTKEERYVQGIRFQPGNLELAHHARLMLDTTHLLRSDDGSEAGDTATQFTRLGVRLASQFWNGWVPGNFGEFYPDGFAKKLPANADIVLNMHYSPSPVPATDQSSVKLWFAPKPPERLVKPFILDENWIVNQPFVIPADTVVSFFLRSPPIPTDISLLSVLPHMHLLGKSFKAYALTPDNDVILLIKIDDWNFKWQMTYQFEHLLKLPKGTVVYAEAVYDNTAANPANPHNPPRETTYGWATFNEMMNLIFEYVDYREGDEGLSLFEKF